MGLTTGIRERRSVRHFALAPLVVMVCALFGAVGTSSASAAPPANDDFANAELISGSNLSVAGTLTDATMQPGEPASAFGSIFSSTVWYEWTAPASGPTQLSSNRSGVGIGAYTGTSVTSLTIQNQNFTPVTFTATEGVTYRIAVADPSSNPVGAFTLNLALTPAAETSNDNFADAKPISGFSSTVTVNLQGSTLEQDEPDHFAGFAINSVWYRWTAPQSGQVSLSVSGGALALLSAYTGTTIGNLTKVSTNPPGAITFEAVEGTTYRIAVSETSFQPITGPFQFTLFQAHPPENDDFADAETLTGSHTSGTGATGSATREPGEPDHYNGGGQASVWFKWVAPDSGSAILNGCIGNNYVTAVAAYTGSSLNSLTEVGSSSCRVQFRAIAGETYHFAFDYDGSSGPGGTSIFSFNLDLYEPAPNDDFADAEVLTGSTASVNSDLRGASLQPGEPAHYPFPSTGSVWYSWTAPAAGSVRIKVPAGTYAVLAVYTGTALGNLTQVVSNADSTSFTAAEGTTYHFAVAETSFFSVGAFTLNLKFSPPPANDDFADAKPLSGTTVTENGDTHGATHEIGEPEHNSSAGDASVWYSWSAPESGSTVIEACGPNQSISAIAVYTGTEIDQLAPVASGNCQFRFDAIANEDYRIAVDSSSAQSNAFTLRIKPAQAPPNDDFEDAQTIAGSSASVNGSLTLATIQPGEPAETGYFGIFKSTVWYKWTAPASGPTTVSSDSNVGVLVATGTEVTGLTEVAANFAPVTFSATEGTTYRIAIGGMASNAVAGFSLDLNGPQSIDESASIESTFASRTGSFSSVNFGPANWHFKGDVTAPFPAKPKVLPIKKLKIELPGDVELQPDDQVTPPCPDSEVGPGADLNHPPDTIVARCPNSVLGNGAAELYLGQTNSASGPNLKDGELVLFNGGTNGAGIPVIKIHAYSQSTAVGLYMEGLLQNGELEIDVPRLTADSGIGSMTLDIPGTQHSVEIRRGQDPGVVQARCSTGALLTGGQFTLGSRDIAGVPYGAEKIIDAPDASSPCVAAPSDTTPPITVITSGPSGNTADTAATFAFVADEAGVTFECDLDGGGFQACTSPKSYTALGNGSHTFRVRGTDPAGNQAAQPATRTWTVTPTATTTTTTGTVPSGGTVTTDPANSGPTPQKPATASITLPAAGQVQVVQGPAGQAPGGFAVIGQQFQISAPDATVAEPLILAFRLDASALPSGVQPGDLTLLRDGVPAANCSGPAGTASPDPCISDREVLSDGDVVLTVLSSHASSWILAYERDTTPPDTFIDSISAHSGQATITFHGTPGDTAKIECKVDNEAFVVCTSPKSFTGLKNGSHTVTIRAEDASGNQDPTPVTAKFQITPRPPVAVNAPR